VSVIVGIIWPKPVLTHASIICEGMLAGVSELDEFESGAKRPRS